MTEKFHWKKLPPKGYAFLATALICFLASLVWLVQLRILAGVFFAALGVVAVWAAMGGLTRPRTS